MFSLPLKTLALTVDTRTIVANITWDHIIIMITSHVTMLMESRYMFLLDPNSHLGCITCWLLDVSWFGTPKIFFTFCPAESVLCCCGHPSYWELSCCRLCPLHQQGCAGSLLLCPLPSLSDTRSNVPSLVSLAPAGIVHLCVTHKNITRKWRIWSVMKEYLMEVNKTEHCQ